MSDVHLVLLTVRPEPLHVAVGLTHQYRNMVEVHYSHPSCHVSVSSLSSSHWHGHPIPFGCLPVRGGGFSPLKLAIVLHEANRRADYRLSKVR